MRPKTHTVLLSISLSVVGLPALAADLPARIEPAPAIVNVPSLSWTGFYLGG